MTNEKKQRILITAFYYISFIGLGLASGVLGPSLLRLADNTSATIAQASSILLFHALGYMVGAVAGGRSYDRVAGHPVMSVMLVIIAASLAFSPCYQPVVGAGRPDVCPGGITGCAGRGRQYPVGVGTWQ